MGSGLKLRVDKHLQGTNIPRKGVIVNIYALEGQTSKRNIIVPVGKGSDDKKDYKEIDLAPGAYLVEAVLPSGDIISREAVAEEGLWQEIELQGDPSAHEWHSFHNLLGNVESQKSYSRRRDAVPELPPLHVWTIKTLPHQLRSGRETWQTLSSWISKGSTQILHDLKPWLEISPTIESDKATQLHSFRMGAEDLEKQYLPRWYSLVNTKKTTQLVSVPAPWFNLTSEKELTVNLLTQLEEGAIKASFSIPDLDLSTALGYMTRGALQAAAQLVDEAQAVEMLFQKGTNPLGAVGGAYILLGTERVTEQRPWHNWVENLMNRFPWLPDGAIQYAWLQLTQASSQESRSRARAALITAFNRGLPYYTLGLQWMINGLTLLAEDDDEAQEMLSAVQKISWRADTSQTFTSIALAR